MTTTYQAQLANNLTAIRVVGVTGNPTKGQRAAADLADKVLKEILTLTRAIEFAEERTWAEVAETLTNASRSAASAAHAIRSWQKTMRAPVC